MNRIDLPILPDSAPPDAACRVPPSLDSEPGVKELVESLKPYVEGGVVVAFSGGLDSAFLLWAAREAAVSGGELVALTTVSASTPPTDLDDAKAFALSLGIEHLCLAGDELDSEAYARNDHNRCYECKAGLFRIAKKVAEERGLRWIMYGYTASDHHDVRPGHRAAVENGVVAPLSEAGLQKSRIRILMKEQGLKLAEKPASPCLSSRITTGIRVTSDRLADVEAMEAILRRGGLHVYRARICEVGSSLFFRIEVDPSEIQKVLGCHEALASEGLRRGYRWVTLDLAGYRTGGGMA
jgi:uncharacterized protein